MTTSQLDETTGAVRAAVRKRIIADASLEQFLKECAELRRVNACLGHAVASCVLRQSVGEPAVGGSL